MRNTYNTLSIRTVIAVSAVALATGCASTAQSITATPMPQSMYSNVTCIDLEAQDKQIAVDLTKKESMQNAKAAADGTTFVIGFLFPPMWLAQAVTGGNTSVATDIGMLKGQQVAVQKEIIARCSKR